MEGCGTGEYQRLMAQYPLVTDAFLGLDQKFQDVIADICKRMGNGMADFIPQEVRWWVGGVAPAFPPFLAGGGVPFFLEIHPSLHRACFPRTSLSSGVSGRECCWG